MAKIGAEFKTLEAAVATVSLQHCRSLRRLSGLERLRGPEQQAEKQLEQRSGSSSSVAD